jgi:hypothetical protein
LRVVVSPDRVTLLQMQRTLAARGLRRTIHDAYSVPCDGAGSAQPWRAALLELETALPGYAGGKVAATVILSNHFMRYTLVPWQAELADAEEELAFARHCFTRIYGESAQQWALRLSRQGREAPGLASAADAELLDTLRAVFGRAGIALRSIQPQLMAACNGFRGQLGRRSAWLALLEPGNLCLGLVQQGNWQRLRSLRIGDAWQAELPLILEREAFLADTPAVPREIYLWNAGAGEAALPESDTWQFHALKPAPESAAATDPGRHVAWAMSG